jgi:hypothetical protein
MRSYLPISNAFDTIYCYETKPTSPFPEPVGFSFASVGVTCVNIPKVVPYASAVVPGAMNAAAVAIQQNHTQMVKFPSMGVKDYKDIARHVELMVAKAGEKVEANWVDWDASTGEYAIPCKSLFSNLTSVILGSIQGKPNITGPRAEQSM